MKTVVYLVRHGKTAWNEQRRLQGWNDIPLSNTGRREARKIGKQLMSVTVHAIYSSPLSRAYDTALEIARHHAIDVTVLDALKETGFGIFEGLMWDELLDHPLVKNRPKNHDRFTDNTGGGESIQDSYVRAAKAMDEIISKHKGQTVVIVSHGLLMKTIAYHMGLVDKERIELLVIRNAYPYAVEYTHDTKKYLPVGFPVEWHDYA